MPRIRTLKPEHRQHRKVGPLTDREYRLWVGMILEADDEGRLVCDAAQLRALVFAYQPKVPLAAIEAALARLEGVGLIRLYGVGTLRYADFPSWHDHQRIDRKQPSRLPMYEASTNGHRTLVTDLEGKGGGIEGKGTEHDVGPAPDGAPLTTMSKGHDHGPAALSTAAREILAFLNKKAGRNYQPLEVNLSLISARLREGATVAQCRAVIGLKCAAWQGDPKMTLYLRPATLFNREKFAQYLGELPATAFTGDT